MTLIHKQLTVICFTVSLLNACSIEATPEATSVSGNSDNLPLNILYKSNICGTHQDSQWLGNQEAYHAAFNVLSRQTIADSDSQPPAVDFKSSGVLLVSMGQKRTGGYTIDLASQRLRVENNSALVEIGWHEPESGMMLAQMLTNPCLFVDVPRGEYNTIQVIDQSQKVRALITVN